MFKILIVPIIFVLILTVLCLTLFYVIIKTAVEHGIIDAYNKIYDDK